MTDTDLSKYFWLAKEIEAMEKELYATYSDGNFEKERKKILGTKIKEASLELLTIEEFLDNLDDPEMRLILRLRYCMRMTWEDIGNEIFMSPSGALRKCKRFLIKLSCR